MKKFDKIFKKRLESLLIEAGLINEEIAEHVRNRERESGDLIGEILVTEGYVREEDVARELSRILQLPFLTIENYRVSSKTVEAIPKDLLHRHQVVPVDQFGDTYSIAMGQHLTLEGFKEIQAAAGGEVTFFVALMSKVKNLLNEIVPMEAAKVADLRRQKASTAGKPSSWTDIFDTANKTVIKGLDDKAPKKPTGLGIFDTGNKTVMKGKPPS